MDILGLIAGLFTPATKLIDDLVTSDEERMELQNKLAEIQKDVVIHMMDLQGKVIEASSKVAVAETQSDSWFTRTYRPMIVCGMFLLLLANAFGLLAIPLPDIFVTIFGSVFGVVGISRGVEKIFTIKGRND